MSTQDRVPLFINRFSLSPRTAIGVQTHRLLQVHTDWLHFHWWTNSLKQLDQRSVLLENRVQSRFSFLHGARFSRIAESLGVSWWGGDNRLRPWAARRIKDQYRDRVSSVYLAPLSEWDAKRCLSLTNLAGAPFVVHLWDVLSGDITKGALRELIDRAERVYCVSSALLKDVSWLRSDAELLCFSRDASGAKAAPREEGPLVVAMHGNITSYAEGLEDLDQAIELVEAQGLQVEVQYLGSPKILQQTQTPLKKRMKGLGFFPTEKDLDRALSRTHVGFLPGPKLDPRGDLRSRYSIPSRVQDYLAVGLPVIGTVHAASATGEFLRGLGLEASTACSRPQQIAEWLLRLAQPAVWTRESCRSRAAFAQLHNQEAPAQKLKRVMDQIANASENGSRDHSSRRPPVPVRPHGAENRPQSISDSPQSTHR
jgi:glycosyltransferase involved in cell wall biosynthesis